MLVLYAAFVLLVSLVHDPRLLAGALIAVVSLAGAARDARPSGTSP